MTAAGFRVARVAPMLGPGTLAADDEWPGAEPVLVIAREEWERRFGADPAIIGRTVRLDGVVHTIVGVMPRGLPLSCERSPAGAVSAARWIDARRLPRSWCSGPADDITLAQAQAELTTIGRRLALEHPRTH